MGHGEHRAIDAAAAAVSSPLLETSMDGARSILLSITGGSDLSLWEVNEAAKAVSEAAHPDANIIFGAMVDENLSDQVWVTVVATGYGDRPARGARAASTSRSASRASCEPERRGSRGRPRAALVRAARRARVRAPRVLAARGTNRARARRACANVRRVPARAMIAAAALSVCARGERVRGPGGEPLRRDPQRHDRRRRHHARAQRRRDASSATATPHELPDPLLIDAENLADAMTAPATKGERLPSGPRPVYTYVVTTPSGTFSFSDDTPHLGGTMRKLAAWVYTVTTTVCHHR